MTIPPDDPRARLAASVTQALYKLYGPCVLLVRMKVVDDDLVCDMDMLVDENGVIVANPRVIVLDHPSVEEAVMRNAQTPPGKPN